jgi:tripartite-type tricarboxylate transporter receptor subunit TctC
MKLLRAAACLATLLVAGESSAQTYPSRSVRIVVPYPAGGPTDVMARLVAQKLSEALGQQFYVENQGGAAGTIGTLAVGNAPADGYTLLFVASDFIVQPAVRAKAPFDPIRGFAPVTLLAAAPEMIAVTPSLPTKNLQELIAFLRANPGKHSYASPGAGSSARSTSSPMVSTSCTCRSRAPHRRSRRRSPAIPRWCTWRCPRSRRPSKTAGCARSP